MIAPGAGKTLSGHGNQVYSVAWSADGKQLATGAADKTARQWDVAKAAQVRQMNAHANVVYTVAFSPKGDMLATGGDDKLIKYWSAADGKELRKSEGHGAPIYSLSFHRDGTRLASGSVDKTVRIWNVADGKELHKLDGHTDDVYGVAYSPDGKRLASVGYGGNLLPLGRGGGKAALEPEGRRGRDDLRPGMEPRWEANRGGGVEQQGVHFPGAVNHWSWAGTTGTPRHGFGPMRSSMRWHLYAVELLLAFAVSAPSSALRDDEFDRLDGADLAALLTPAQDRSQTALGSPRGVRARPRGKRGTGRLACRLVSPREPGFAFRWKPSPTSICSGRHPKQKSS